MLFGQGAERLVLQPDGAFVGGVLGGLPAGSTTTLELADGTQGTLTALGDDSGTVTDSAGSFGFSADWHDRGRYWLVVDAQRAGHARYVGQRRHGDGVRRGDQRDRHVC